VTDTNTTTAGEDEFFDSATSEFPAKEDLNGRLVAIWNTGKTGTRKSEANNDTYGYVETVTLVLDDGPDDWYATNIKRMAIDGKGDPAVGADDCLVPSVRLNGPQRLDDFQWSATGIYSRASKRKVGDKPMIGRINSKKNAKKGFSDAWSIAEMTEDDKVTARKYLDVFREISAEMQKKADGAAFE
jgi:hypothetical protein